MPAPPLRRLLGMSICADTSSSLNLTWQSGPWLRFYFRCSEARFEEEVAVSLSLYCFRAPRRFPLRPDLRECFYANW